MPAAARQNPSMIDLHSHSTASDGDCAPPRLVELALGMGIRALALTDHDTIAGVAQAEARARGTGLLLIPGVEVEIESLTGEFHLLGLGLFADRGSLDAALDRVRVARRGRNARMVAKLQAAGIPIAMEELSAIAGGEIVSRAHFARLLVQKRVVNSIDAAFSRLIGKGAPFYEPRACLGIREAVELIGAAGGFSAVAHPTSLGMNEPALRQHLSACRDIGVRGLEAWHPNHTLKQCHRLERLARAMGMLVTGGSDFHGQHMPQRRLGLSSGGREVPDALLEALPLHPTGG